MACGNGITIRIAAARTVVEKKRIAKLSLPAHLVSFRLDVLADFVKEEFMAAQKRQLSDLISIGPAMLRDFQMLGVRSVPELAKRNPQRMYEKLGQLVGQRQDPCVLDTFCAAVAQAKNPRLPAEQCQWWWWSQQRKNERAKVRRRR